MLLKYKFNNGQLSSKDVEVLHLDNEFHIKKKFFGINLGEYAVKIKKKDLENTIKKSITKPNQFAAASAGATGFASSPSIMDLWFPKLGAAVNSFVTSHFTNAAYVIPGTFGGKEFRIPLADGGHYINFGIIPAILELQKNNIHTGTLFQTVQIAPQNVAKMFSLLQSDKTPDSMLQCGRPLPYILEENSLLLRAFQRKFEPNDQHLKYIYWKIKTRDHKYWGIKAGSEYTFVAFFGNGKRNENPDLAFPYITPNKHAEATNRIRKEMRELLKRPLVREILQKRKRFGL